MDGRIKTEWRAIQVTVAFQLQVYNYTFSSDCPTSDVNQAIGEEWTKAEKKELRGMEGEKAENAKETES